jgi:hypothetical protein
MPIDPNIALAVKTPQPENVLDAYGKAQALIGGAQQRQLTAQQIQGAQLENQQRQIQLDQTKAVNEAYLGALSTDESGTPTIDAGKLSNALATHNAGAAIPGVLKGVTEFQQSAATLAKTRGEVQQQQVDLGGSLGAAVKSSGYDPHLFITLATHAVQAKAADPQTTLPVLQKVTAALQQDPTGQSAKQLVQQFADQLIAASPKQAEATKNTAQAGEAGAVQKQKTLETQLTQQKIDAYNSLKQPGALENRVASSIDPKQYPNLYTRAVAEARNAPDLDGINAAIQKNAQNASEQEKTIATETNPSVLQARTKVAVATAQATAPIETAKAIATAKALRMGDNPSVAGVAPAAVGQVQNQAIKLDEEYAKAKASTESLGKFLDAAERGNKAAGSNLPLLGVETINAINGIKRINGAEISTYSGAGDLLDRIQGKIGKLTKGEPIPQDVLNDIRDLHQTLGQQSYQNYTDSLNSLNSRTGAKFAPTLAAPNISKPAAPGGNAAPVPPLITTKADFDKLASGALYKESDGKTYRKP